MDLKPVIVDALVTLQQKEQQEGNVFKARAYGKVVAQLKASNIGSINSMSDLDGIAGVGKKIRAKLEEIVATGSLGAAERLKNDRQVKMAGILNNIHGVGPATTRKILDKHPVDSLEELRRVLKDHPNMLNTQQTIGLMYYEDFLVRIPRHEVASHEATLLEAVTRVCEEGFWGDVVGSYRRGACDSGDIDMLIGYGDRIPDNVARLRFKQLVASLQQSGYITDVLANGPKKFMGVCKLPNHPHARRLDLLLTPAHEHPYALLYFTGSDNYNVKVRQHALDRGYKLNEHGLEAVGSVPDPPNRVVTEEDILAFLGLPFTPPTQRT